MPYRALMWSVVTVGLALLAVGLWVRAVEPMVAGTHAATPTPSTLHQSGTATPEQQLGTLVKGTLMLAFVLICALLVVGFFGTFREWMRYHGGVGRGPGKEAKTKYVDAWKIAGERLKEKDEEPQDPGSEA